MPRARMNGAAGNLISSSLSPYSSSETAKSARTTSAIAWRGDEVLIDVVNDAMCVAHDVQPTGRRIEFGLQEEAYRQGEGGGEDKFP